MKGNEKVEDTKVKNRRTDHTMVPRRRTKGKATIYKTLHRKSGWTYRCSGTWTELTHQPGSRRYDDKRVIIATWLLSNILTMSVPYKSYSFQKSIVCTKLDIYAFIIYEVQMALRKGSGMFERDI